MDRRRKERLRHAQEVLGAQIADLKTDLSDRDLEAAVKAGSSVGHVKTVEEYDRDRELYLQDLLKVPTAKPLNIQYETLLREAETCTQSPYTPSTLPLTLHQFYMDRTALLVQLKHMHLVRWTRFAVGQAKVTEELQVEFQERMARLMQEYNDALNRARRLAVSRDILLAEKTPPTSLVDVDDILVYLRWKVFHLHTIRNTAAFLLGIRWFPWLHHEQFSKALVVMGATSQQTTKQVTLSVPQTRWLSVSKSLLGATKLQSQSRISQLSQTTHNDSSSHSPFTMRGLAAMTMASALGGKGGVADVRMTGNLPMHTTDVYQLQGLLQELMLVYSIGGLARIQSPSEHLQLYYQANRKFRIIFDNQELLSTYHTYDRTPEGDGGSKNMRSRLTFRKPANWLPYIRIRPEPDPVQIAAFVKMRETVTGIDPLLSLCSQCTHLHDAQRVLYALRQHSVAVRHPSPVTPLSVTSHKTSHDTMLVWRCIYSGLDSRNPLNTNESSANIFDTEDGMSRKDMDMAPEGDVPANQDSNIDVPEAMKLIGNEEGRAVSSKAHSTPKDAYFAFLLLRHLRIRDVRIKCLSILNYFRSVERTLTINCEGLSLESGRLQAGKKQGGGLNHRHLFNTPIDYVINETEFMQYSEVENHDDFYSFSGSSDVPVRVWDPQGVGIVYDAALEDLEKMENELLLVGSYYIQQDGGQKKPLKMDKDIDIGTYSQQCVDRFAVLLDLWSAEAQFLEAKMKVVDCYLEAYNHVYDQREKKRLVQVLTTLLSSRPRHSPEAPYFSKTYEQECQCLRAQCHLLQAVVSYQITEERTYNQQMCDAGTEEDAGSFGLPPPLIPKHLISLSGDRQLLIHSHLLEFCNSLCIVASLPTAIQWALSEIVHQHHVISPLHIISLHCKLLEVILTEWEQKTEMGASYSHDLQRNLFAGVCAEDPHLLSELCLLLSNQSGGGEADAKQQKRVKLQTWANLLQVKIASFPGFPSSFPSLAVREKRRGKPGRIYHVVSLRHHLLLMCSESELLTRLYKQQLSSLDQEECHAHLRCVPFDFTMKFPGDKNLEYFIGQSKEGSAESRVDRYTPVKLHLAVHELDEKHLGNFSFRSREGIMKLLSGKNGVENLMVSLEAQVVHRNALVMACQQNYVVHKYTALQQRKKGSQILDDTKSPMSTVSFQSPRAPPTATPTGPIATTASQVADDIQLAKKMKGAVVSIQREKTPIRDHLLAQFTTQPTTILRNQEELERTKCVLIKKYCKNLMNSMSHLSLKTQIMRYYDSLQDLLESFPATRDAYFTLCKVSATTSDRMATLRSIKDPRQYRSRPPAILSKDGNQLLNIWYIPHYSEILDMFSDLPMEDCQKALTTILHLVAPLHDLLQYVCAYVRLGSNQARMGTKQVGANWGGTEGIGAELQQLQSEISCLGNPSDPTQVGEYLSTRCRVLFLEHVVMVNHCLRRSFLFNGNTAATKTLDSITTHKLSDHPTPHLCYPMLQTTPTPLDLLPCEKSRDLLPWKHFLCTYGPYQGSLSQCWEVGAHVYTTLALLVPSERSMANGEILGMSLLLEDVVQSSDLATPSPQDTISSIPPISTLTPRHSARIRRASMALPEHVTTPRPCSPSQTSLSSNLSRLSVPVPRGASATRRRHSVILTSPPIPSLHIQVLPFEAAKLIETFLLVTYKLETLKREWGLKVLNEHAITTQRQCQLLEDVYRDKVVGVARKWVAKQQSRDLARMQMENETMDDTISVMTFLTEASSEAPSADTLEMSDSLSELKLREAQISRLMELLEQQMIRETCQHLSHLHHLMLSERERDDTTLPLDLWKKNQSMKELMGLPRPHVVEDFISQLTSGSRVMEKGDLLHIPKAHLKECLHHLSGGVLAREKECYQMYSSYYEGILLSQYNQLYLKNQEIDHHRALADSAENQTREETLVFMGEHTHSLILEITALRPKISQLERALQQQEEDVRRRVQQEYSSLVSNLFSTSHSVKNRFEDYRGQLFSDVTTSLHEVREMVAGNISKMREKLGLQTTDSTVTTITALKAEGLRDIQEENAQLNKMVIKMRSMNQWNRMRTETSHEQEVSILQTELDASRTRFMEQKMTAEEDILSLKQQVKVLRKSLGRAERECGILKQSLMDEKHKKHSSTKATSKTQDGSASKAEKIPVTKIDQLITDLEVKNKQLKTLTADQNRMRQQTDAEKTKSSCTVRQVKQQLHRERHLKLEAFHQVEDLLTQVRDYEAQQQPSLKASLHAIQRQSQSSASASPLPSPALATQHRIQRPKSQQGRLRMPSNGEMIDLSQEILALKLI